MDARQRQALDYFVGQGWTPAQSAGLVANLVAESGLRPDAVGDGGAAYGIAQWHPDRQAGFAALIGKDIRGSTLEEQLAFVHAELVGTEADAGNRLRACTTAADAGACVSMYYERPADRDGEAQRRAAMASTLAQGTTPDAAAPEPVAPQEAPMGLAVLLPTLLQTMLGIFQPRIAQQLGKVTDQPAETLTPLLTTFFTQAGQALGVLAQGQQVSTAQQAVQIASAAQTAGPQHAQQLEDAAMQLIDHAMPLIDKMYEQEAISNAATRQGRNEAAQRGSERGRMVMVGIIGFLSSCVVLGLLGALIYQIVLSANHEPSVALVGFGGPILTLAIKYLGDCVAFYMDGTPASNAALASNQVLASALDRRSS